MACTLNQGVHSENVVCLGKASCPLVLTGCLQGSDDAILDVITRFAGQSQGSDAVRGALAAVQGQTPGVRREGPGAMATTLLTSFDNIFGSLKASHVPSVAAAAGEPFHQVCPPCVHKVPTSALILNLHVREDSRFCECHRWRMHCHLFSLHLRKHSFCTAGIDLFLHLEDNAVNYALQVPEQKKIQQKTFCGLQAVLCVQVQQFLIQDDMSGLTDYLHRWMCSSLNGAAGGFAAGEPAQH